MSLVEDTSQETDQRELDVRLQEDESSDPDPENQKDKNTRTTDLLRRVNPLSLLKEDLSQFKDEVLKVFRDKDMKTEHEDCPSSQAESKPASSVLDLLKEDLSQFKEDVTSVFAASSSKDKETDSAGPKTSQSTEKTINRLSFLKGDFYHLKDDLSNVFRIGPSKERDNKGVTAKEDSSNASKIKVSTAERADETLNPLSLFRRDQKSPQAAEDSPAGRETLSETDEEQTDEGLRGDLSEETEETVDADKVNNNMTERTREVEDGEVDITVSEEETEKTTSLSEIHQSEETVPTSQAAEGEDRSDSSVASAEDERTNQEEDEEQKPLEALLWEPLSSGISLFNLRDDTRDQPGGGDSWSVKNFACYLTFDPNTANSELRLTDCNRTATRVWSDHRPSDHPDRFEHCPQVLCREGLLDSVYWEVEWTGGADVGITYNSVSRDGDAASCLLGHNEQSWSLECSEGSYTPCHDNKRFGSSSPRPFTRRVGVYLDWFAGSLSFYCVSQDSMTHLHTFTSTFTEPLYPGFWIWSYDGSVSLRQVELDWERLLQ